MKAPEFAEALADLLQGKADVTDVLPPPARVLVEALPGGGPGRTASIEIEYMDPDETRVETRLTLLIIKDLPSQPIPEEPDEGQELLDRVEDAGRVEKVPPTCEGYGPQARSGRLTAGEKAFYRMDGWSGRCPECGERFAPNDPSITQRGVVVAIERHVAEVHDEKR